VGVVRRDRQGDVPWTSGQAEFELLGDFGQDVGDVMLCRGDGFGEVDSEVDEHGDNLGEGVDLDAALQDHHVADILAKVAKKFKLRLSAFDDKKPSELGQSYIGS
jgi:hypothetical protein